MALEQKDDISPIPTPEFSVRTGQPLGKAQVSQSETSQPSTTSQKSRIKRRGVFLQNRLGRLYSDPIYKNADESIKQYYKEKAYDKWVVPYYNHIGEKPPSKEAFLSGVPEKSGSTFERWNQRAQGSAASILKETSKVSSGLMGLMSYVGAAIDNIALPKPGEKDYNPNDKTSKDFFLKGQKYFENLEEFYSKEVEASNDGHAASWRQTPEQKLAEVTTQAIFFEATGAAKGAKVLQLANPKTASVITRIAKSSWNTSAEFGLWSASQGDKPSDIAETAGTGAVLGGAGRGLTDMFRVLFKYGGSSAAKVIINDGVKKAIEGHGADVIDVKATKLSSEDKLNRIKALLPESRIKEAKGEVVSISPLTRDSQVASSAVSVRLHAMSQERYNKSFDKLPWIQQRGIINKFLSNDVLRSQVQLQDERLAAEVLHTFMKENQEKLNQVSPTAQKVEESVNKFVKENGKEPVVNKLKATMPHHNTTVDSEWKHLQARASFLKNQLRRATTPEEKKEITQALNEEYSLMKRKSQIEKSKKGSVGSAGAGDTNVFKGEDLLVRPASRQDAYIFGSWKDDKFAGDMARQIAKDSPVGMLDRNVQKIMTSFQAGNMLEMHVRDSFQDNIILHHSKYGPIGGANFSVIGEGKDNTLMLNWIALRPNVVVKAFDTPGAGQALFLNILERARAENAGVELHSAPSAVDFYRKMGMEEEQYNSISGPSHNFYLTADRVKEILKEKGLIMALLGSGIGTWAATQDQLNNDIDTEPRK